MEGGNAGEGGALLAQRNSRRGGRCDKAVRGGREWWLQRMGGCRRCLVGLNRSRLPTYPRHRRRCRGGLLWTPHCRRPLGRPWPVLHHFFLFTLPPPPVMCGTTADWPPSRPPGTPHRPPPRLGWPHAEKLPPPTPPLSWKGPPPPTPPAAPSRPARPQPARAQPKRARGKVPPGAGAPALCSPPGR